MSAPSDDELDQPQAALALTRKGAPKYVIIRDQPCKLVEARLKPKATARGNDRMELQGTHLETGKLYVDTLRGDTMVPVLKVSTTTYTLLDVDASDGSCSLMDAQGEVKDDARLGLAPDSECAGDKKWDAIGLDLIAKYEAGESLQVTVFSAMGKDVIVDFKVEEADEGV